MSLLSPSTLLFHFSLMKWLSCQNAKYSDRLLGAGSVEAVLRTRIAILVVFTDPKYSLPSMYLPLVYVLSRESKSTHFFHYLIFTNHAEEQEYLELFFAHDSSSFCHVLPL